MQKVIDWLQLLILAWLLMNLVMFEGGITTFRHLKQNIVAQELLIEKVEDSTNRLKQKITWLEQEGDYVEMVARTKWGLVQSGDFFVT
jgi:cell division protein FtsB